MIFYSPLRYPGGKNRLAPFIKSVIKENSLLGVDYVEPYAGGSAVALSLLFEEYVSNILINDIDRSIYAFWHSAVNSTDKFCERIENTKVDIPNWIEAKRIQSNKSAANLFELGFSTFFLNRTNVSGVMKGGVIGGLKQQGKYKIDARFNKKSLIERIQKIGGFTNRINVTNNDALKLLMDINETSFIYLDPPYINKAKGLYVNFYTEKDHINLAKFIKGKLSKTNYWITSYDKTSFILKSYKDCKNRMYWKNRYSTSRSVDTQEVIFVTDNLVTKKSSKFLYPHTAQVTP